jgi:hypothetical protein
MRAATWLAVFCGLVSGVGLVSCNDSPPLDLFQSRFLCSEKRQIFGRAKHAQRLCGSLQVDIRKTREALGLTP